MALDSGQDQPRIPRGAALKLGIVGAAGALLTACGIKPSSPETPTPLPTVPATPEKPTYQSEFVITGEENENIWQVEINSANPTVLEAVATIAPEKGYALTLIKADLNEAVIFSGPSGRGQKAILVVDNLFKNNRLNDLPKFINPSNCSEGDKIVFGKTVVVDENFRKLLRENNPLQSLSQYLEVNLDYYSANEQQILTIKHLKRLTPDNPDYGAKEWESAQYKIFTGDLEGNWVEQLQTPRKQ